MNTNTDQRKKKGMRNRFLTDAQLNEKAADFVQLQNDHESCEQDHVCRVGNLCAEVKVGTNRGGWGKWCERVGIERRWADQHIFVVSKLTPEQLRGVGIAKALLLAQHRNKAAELLQQHEALANMTVKELKETLRGKPKPKAEQEKALPRRQQDQPGYREGLEDGQKAKTLVAWAAGVLFLRPEDIAAGGWEKAQSHYQALKGQLSDDYRSTLDEAMNTLAEELSAPAAA